MPNIVHVELSDTFNKQRQIINTLVDYANSNPAVIPGNGISKESSGVVSVKKLGDGLSFDSSGNLIGNDAYPDLLTQVVLDPDSPAPAPTVITSTTITFPAFSVIFDTKVYYGKVISDFTTLNVPETVMTVEEGDDGAIFVYVDSSGEIHQTMNSITPGNSSTQCLLGSYFRLNNQIQSGSWAYTPWNGSTSKDTRFLENGALKGGLLKAATASTLSRDAVSVVLEGVNAAVSVYTPNYKEFSYESPYSTKKLWPGYDASVSDSTVLDTTHIYNITDETVDDISSEDGYIVLIPGLVAPIGQDVYLMAMSPKSGGTYSQIFPTMDAAVSGVYSLQVSLGNVASRVLWLGQSIIVKIGATDFTDPSQLRIIGGLPNALGIYGDAASGGAGSRVTGITVKGDGVIIGEEDKKRSLNFTTGFSVLNTSQNEVEIICNASPASQSDVNSGTGNVSYVTPLTLKNQNYLASIKYVGSILQQEYKTSWPITTTASSWPHTIMITAVNDYTMPNVHPAYDGKILTWEVVVKNNSINSISIIWPSTYQPFNGETLLDNVDPNTSVFFMMRRYSNNFTLVSLQGIQSNLMI